jgi:Lar family restriction alleviation protein
MTSELKACPFCGGTDISVDHAGRDSHFFVQCNDCDVVQDYDHGHTRAEAIAAWNTRPPVPDKQLTDVVEHGDPTDYADSVAGDMRSFYARCRDKSDPRGNADNLMIGLLNIVLAAYPERLSAAPAGDDVRLLREALEPFAQAWGRPERKPDHVFARELTFADYERARSALKAATHTEEKAK